MAKPTKSVTKTRKSLTKKRVKKSLTKKTPVKKSYKSSRSRTYKLNVSNGMSLVSDNQNAERRILPRQVHEHIISFIKMRAHNVLEDILKNLKNGALHKTEQISESVYLHIYLTTMDDAKITMGYNNGVTRKLLDISSHENIMTLESTTSFLDHFEGIDETNERLRAKRLAQRIITESCHWIRFEKDGNKRVVTIDLGIKGQDNFMANKILIMTILILLYQDGMENYRETIPPLIFRHKKYYEKIGVLVLYYENYKWEVSRQRG